MSGGLRIGELRFALLFDRDGGQNSGRINSTCVGSIMWLRAMTQELISKNRLFGMRNFSGDSKCIFLEDVITLIWTCASLSLK